MANTANPKTVLVSGDPTVDWNVVRAAIGGDGVPATTWWGEHLTRACWQAGGSALLAHLIEAVGGELQRSGQPGYVVLGPRLPRRPRPGDGRFHHSYALWTRYPRTEPGPDDRGETAWRVERFLGLDRAWEVMDPKPGGFSLEPATGEPAALDLVALDDADLGFRGNPSRWPSCIREAGHRSWILIKMAWPVARGQLWEHLQRTAPDRLIAVTTVADLRRTEVQISRELSWERTAQDVVWELTFNPQVNALARCRHVVVSFGTVGALLLSRATPPANGSALFFDPKFVEGMWNVNHPGGMIGYTSCLTAAIAHQILANPEQPDLAAGVQTGVAAMRLLHQAGYDEGRSPSGAPRFTFPFRTVAREILSACPPLATARLQDPLQIRDGLADGGKSPRVGGYWTILGDRYPGALDAVAEAIVLKGAEVALEGVPLGQFGKLTTADRRETEGLRSIRTLIAEYCARTQNRPLCIAVFGPPGAGKSFGVKQVAASTRSAVMKPLEFSLAQFESPADLREAFHQVRDIGLTERLPLVFWDEFDSACEGQPLGWLRHFLSPMQDGVFLEGQVKHPIGRAVFVFAGGTCPRMEEFDRDVSRPDVAWLKGRDFVSRLRGFVNVLGPNAQLVGGVPDQHYIIRRAIALRLMLKEGAPQIFHDQSGLSVPNIDPGVLRAFLGVNQYKHGARSMEAIIGMSLLSGKTKYERSSLPSEIQLDLHVDGREFLALARRLELEGGLLERLAEGAHAIFLEGKERDKWKLGPRNDQAKTHPLLVPYSELPELFKEANRATVRSIPTKLAVGGYAMMPTPGNEPPFTFPGEVLERLARLEHELWMREKLAQGFTPGEPSEEHPWRSLALVDWEALPEKTKEIDRDLVRGIPEMLARVGYAVVALKGGREQT